MVHLCRQQGSVGAAAAVVVGGGGGGRGEDVLLAGREIVVGVGGGGQLAKVKPVGHGGRSRCEVGNHPGVCR